MQADQVQSVCLCTDWFLKLPEIFVTANLTVSKSPVSTQLTVDGRWSVSVSLFYFGGSWRNSCTILVQDFLFHFVLFHCKWANRLSEADIEIFSRVL